MIVFEEVIICLIVSIFPMLVYLFYVAYKKNLKEKENMLFLNLSLFASLCFIYSIVSYFDNVYYYLFFTIPLLYGYLYKQRTVTIIMSIVIILIFYKQINMDIHILVTTNILYILSYIYYYKKNANKIFFITAFGIITSITGIIYYLFYLNVEEIILFLHCVLLTVIYFLTLYLIDLTITKAREIINMYMTVKEFEHEKQIKVSLFKITHEIKNPITVCKGYLDMFDIKDENKSIKYLSIIREEIDRTLNLLSDFMDFTKIKINKEAIDFNVVLDDIKSISAPLFAKYNIKYNCVTENDLFVMADYNRMKQVLVNLIKNSIEAIEKNGKIELTAYTETNKLYIYLKDNGSGMSSEELEKMQTVFYTTKSNGTGLGVALSREIIEAHGGNLNYKSKIGKGTTVKIILPLN